LQPDRARLRQAEDYPAPRTRDDLERATAAALDAITPLESANWFRHCGYPLPGQPL